MNENNENRNYLNYRSENEHLVQCGQLLDEQVTKLWWLETDCQQFLKICSNKIDSEKFDAFVAQLLLESDLKIKRLRKMCQALNIDPSHFKIAFEEEIAQLMAYSNRAVGDFSKSKLVTQWKLALELRRLIHYKLVYYEALAGWSRHLKLYGIQELLEDSLDEYIHLDLMLSLLTEGWE